MSPWCSTALTRDDVMRGPILRPRRPPPPSAGPAAGRRTSSPGGDSRAAAGARRTLAPMPETRRRRRHAAGDAGLPAWPVPYDAGAELDWADPVTSRRLLREHLDQEHDGASRRLWSIDRHVDRLARILPGPPSRILDAGCGPGLYAVRLARRGHEVIGTDIGPAVLAHARRLARLEGVSERTRFLAADLREPLPPALAGAGFDAVLLLYHALEFFPRRGQAAVLRRLAGALRPGGVLVAEVRTRPDQPPGRVSHWEVVPRSLLGDRPHLLLTDATWDDRRRLYVLRETAVLDGGARLAVQQTTGALSTLDEARRLVARAGLRLGAVHDGWSRYRATGLSESLLLVAERPGGRRPVSRARRLSVPGSPPGPPPAGPRR